MINRTERVHAVDLAKCIAIIGVILIHISSDTIGYAPIKSMEWLCGVFWGSVSRGAVPLFFLCSGALLLDPERELSVGRIWKRNILHLLTALFFWATVYKLYPYIAHGASLRDGIGQSVRELLLWKHETHLYFLHIMLLVYALLPATRLIAAKADRKTLRYLLVLWAVLGVLLCTRYALQSLGQKVLPLFSSVIELVGKVIFVLVFIPKFQYNAVILCEPIIWFFMTAYLVAVYLHEPFVFPKK